MSADTTLPGFALNWGQRPEFLARLSGPGAPRRSGPPARPGAGWPPLPATVAAIIVVADEEPELFRECLDSLLRQTRLPDGLIVVDDGLADPSCARIAHQRSAWFSRRGVRCRVVAHHEPLGWREGLADGFLEFYDADIYLSVGSGTVLREDAVQRALAYFADPRVQAVAGTVHARNWDRNLLTRLTSPPPAAFPGLRAAGSALGAVLCAGGALALYRGPLLRRCMGDFVTQEFLRRPCTSGGDRRLTYYCLREGRVVLARDAVAWTMVPDSARAAAREQLGRARAFIRESASLLRGLGPRRACWWLTVAEIISRATLISAAACALTLPLRLAASRPEPGW